jgi:glucokinase
MRPHLFADDRPPRIHVAGLGDLGGALGAALVAPGHASADG